MSDRSRRLYSAAQLRELERRAVESGVPSYELMQRAGAAAWRALRGQWPQARRIAVICGSGNNGGDGYVLARLAIEQGCEARVYQVGPPAVRGDAVRARADWLAAGGARVSGLPALLQAEVIVDALFGIGLSRPLQPEARQALEAIRVARDAGAGVLALDLPSGLDADTGRLWGGAVQADCTVSFIGHAPGLFTGMGPEHGGRRLLDDLQIGGDILDTVEPVARLLDARMLAEPLRPRLRGAHKGSNGHVLVVGGDHGMAGAALLAARAALRAGAGLVSVATRSAHAPALTAAQPELMCHGIESVDELAILLKRADVVAVGPGLGQGGWGLSLLARVLDSSLPLVVDADALNLLAREPTPRGNWILTPHPGEAGRLLGRATADIEGDRLAAVRELRDRYGGSAVLKGAGSLVSGRQLMLCPYGNPGMAVGGMGDTLTGIIAALLAQGLGIDEAPALGVLVHALAGDRAARQGERGLLPSDLIAELRSVVNPLLP